MLLSFQDTMMNMIKVLRINSHEFEVQSVSLLWLCQNCS